jgi:UDP-glucuronate 4-epimerase
MKVCVTGCAGFIGSHVMEQLVELGYWVTGIDNFDTFYSREIKERNLRHVSGNPRARIIEWDITSVTPPPGWSSERYDAIIHLAARPGVRQSMIEPGLYETVNVQGTRNVLAWAAKSHTTRVLFASSSSVYGGNPRMPWSEDSDVAPLSPYAMNKLRAEELGKDFARDFGRIFVALRLFTVYGPRQRPDLAISKFATQMLRGESVTMYGDGNSSRDYTFIDDVVTGILSALRVSTKGFHVFNVGTGTAVTLSTMVAQLAEALGVHASVKELPPRRGDAPMTLADIRKASEKLDYLPRYAFRDGLRLYCDWIRSNGELLGGLKDGTVI